MSERRIRPTGTVRHYNDDTPLGPKGFIESDTGYDDAWIDDTTKLHAALAEGDYVRYELRPNPTPWRTAAASRVALICPARR